MQKLVKGSAEYEEGLGIIEAGGEQLKKVPRGDMDGFLPCEKDRERLAKYDDRARIEMENRKAIREDRRLYDRDFADSRKMMLLPAR